MQPTSARGEKTGIRPSGLVPIRIRDRQRWHDAERKNGSEEDFGFDSGAWNIEKVEAFRDAFYEFLGHVKINSKEKGGNYCLADGVYEAQYRLLDAIWDGLSEDIHDFKVLKSRQLGMCLDPKTRILTADLRWIPISELRIGEKIVSVDEFPPKGSDWKSAGHRRMREGVVEAIAEVREQAYRISFDDGRTVICTGQHRWLCRKANTETKWRAIERPGLQSHDHRARLLVGDEIRWITKPWVEALDFEDGWFGGMIDGEGSISNENRAGAALLVCQKRGEVFDRLERYAQSRGYTYKIESDLSERPSKFGKDPCPKIVFARMNELFRLVAQTGSTKCAGWKFWEDRELPGKKSGVGWSQIVCIEPLGERTMIDLQTSTKTYIAEGFVSHNSTMTRALIVFWLGMHHGMQGASIYDTEAHKEESREEIEQMIASLPKSLGFPRIVKMNRYNMLLSNESRLRFMAAGVRSTKSSGVLGRSSGINLVHASEICSWENEEGVTALKNALSKNFPDRLYVWESTARGFNSWHDMWQEAKQDDLHQRTVFIGWWAKDDQRIKKSSASFQRYGTDPLTEKERERIEAVYKEYGYEIDAEQLAWYRSWTDPLREREEDDPEDLFMLADQPFTEDECFQASGSTFFEAGKVREHLEFAGRRHSSGYKFSPGTDFVTTGIYKAQTWRDVDIRVWEEPVSDAVYVVSADPAFGHDPKSDNSCVQVGRCYADQIEQVAEFTSHSTLTHQLAYLLWALVGWYGSQPNNQVMTIIEINGPGEAVWREYNLVRPIVENGYLRPAARDKGLTDIFYNARNYLYQRSDSMHPGRSLHFKTTMQLKIAILERLRDFLHNGGIVINSVDALEEMKAITRDGDQIGAEGKGRDDRTMALALMVRAWEEKLRRGLIAQNRTREADVARRRLNPVDQLRIFNNYTLSSFFERKNVARRGVAMAEAQRQLHVRSRMAAPTRGVGMWRR